MSSALIGNLALFILIALAAGVLYGMRMRHLRYLQGEVRALGGQDRWNVRCTHCGRRIRDAASIRHTTRTPVGSGWNERTDGVFHMDRPACAAAADKMRSGT